MRTTTDLEPAGGGTADERFRAAFREAALGMAILDLWGRPVEVNPALERMLGYPADELVGRPIAELALPHGAGEETRLFAELLAGELDSFQLEKRFLSRAGDMVSLNLTVSLLHDAQGCARWALGVVEDVTLRQVREAMQEHATRLRALQELSLGVKHEINNVLAALQANAELLGGSANLTPDERQGVLAMLHCVQRLADAVRRLDRVGELPVVPYVGAERMVDLSPGKWE